MGCKELQLAPGQACADCGCGLRPAPNGIGTVHIGRVAVALVHASLIVDGPGNAGKTAGQLLLDCQVPLEARARVIAVDGVDIATRDEVDRKPVQMIPDRVADQPRTDPAVVDVECSHRPQYRHDRWLAPEEIGYVPSAFHAEDQQAQGEARIRSPRGSREELSM